jgi:hypothetical protein
MFSTFLIFSHVVANGSKTNMIILCDSGTLHHNANILKISPLYFTFSIF